MNTAHYKTTDRYLASFVLSEGAVLAGCTRLGPKRVEYRFVADESLHALLRLYWRGVRILVAPVRLFEAYQTLKNLSITRS